MRSSIVAAVSLWGCGPGGASLDEAKDDIAADSTADADADADADSDADADADADSDADTDTTTTGYAVPTSVTVACTVTTNVLRYTCDVTVDVAQPVQVRWFRTDGVGSDRVATSDLVATDHTLDVIFLGPMHEYTFEASATNWPTGPLGTETQTTGSPPLPVGSWLNMTGASTMGLLGTENPCDGSAVAVIYDTETGDLVWYHDLDPSGSLGMLDMVRFTDEQTVIGETDGQIVEIDLMGNDVVRYPVSYPGCCSLNHDIFKHDDLYWSQYQDISGGLTLDNIVVIDAYGVEQYQWEPEDHLSIPGNASGDYLHTNTEYVDADGNFYLSWLTRDAIGKFNGDRLDPNWGEPIWLMTGDGAPGALGNDITVDWSLVPDADNFGGQHNLHLRHDGRLMLLDNDNGRGVVMTVDELTMTATVDAVYATHESSCGAQGTAMDLSTGNAIVGCNTEWVREYDLATSLAIWEGEIECRNGGGGWLGNAATRWYPLDTW